AAFSPDGSLLVIAAGETAQVWRWYGRDDDTIRTNASGEVGYQYNTTPILTLRHGCSVRSIAFSPDGRHLATAGRFKLVRAPADPFWLLCSITRQSARSRFNRTAATYWRSARTLPRVGPCQPASMLLRSCAQPGSIMWPAAQMGGGSLPPVGDLGSTKAQLKY